MSSFKDSLTQFVWEYAQNHIYLSRMIISGVYVEKFNPIFKKDEYFNKREQQKAISRKLTSIFYILKQLGIVERFSQGTFKVNKEKLNEHSLDMILSHSMGDFMKNKNG